MSKSVIVIGDVHGAYDTLVRLIEKLPEDNICFAGDLVDKGPQSRQVLEYVIENGWDAVKGNHELMMYQSSYDSQIKSLWHRVGGRECLDSYKGHRRLFREHQQWCQKLPLYKEYKDCVDDDGNYLIVSHGDVLDIWEKRHLKHPGSIFTYACMWENDWDAMRDRDGLYDFFNIFGHTPQNNGASIYGSYACIDGGGFIKKPEYNRIIAMQYPSMKIWEEPVHPDTGMV